MSGKVTAKQVLNKNKKNTKASVALKSSVLAGAAGSNRTNESSEKKKLLQQYAQHAANISYFVHSEEGELDRMISTTR